MRGGSRSQEATGERSARVIEEAARGVAEGMRVSGATAAPRWRLLQHPSRWLLQWPRWVQLLSVSALGADVEVREDDPLPHAGPDIICAGWRCACQQVRRLQQGHDAV